MPKRLSRAPHERQHTDEDWWKRLSGGLKRTSSSLGSSITALVTNRQLDAETLDALEDELIRADLGQDFAARIVGRACAKDVIRKAISPDEVKAVARRRD